MKPEGARCLVCEKPTGSVLVMCDKCLVNKLKKDNAELRAELTRWEQALQQALNVSLNHVQIVVGPARTMTAVEILQGALTRAQGE